MNFLAQDVSGIGTDKAIEIAAKAASQPVQWWGALFTIGSLVCVFLVVRVMINSQKETNLMLLSMVREKDLHIRTLNERLMNMMNNVDKPNPIKYPNTS